jgi:hypothetical protein
VNLIDHRYDWKVFNPSTTISRVNGDLMISVNSTNHNEIFNRAFLQTRLNFTQHPLLMSIDFASNSFVGHAKFFMDIRGIAPNSTLMTGNVFPYLQFNVSPSKYTNVIWYHAIDNTTGQFQKREFILPSGVQDKPIEFRFYITTSEPGKHSLIIKNALFSPNLEDISK